MTEAQTALTRLLPPSIAQDQTMAALATVAGAEEEHLRALTDRALIWARLDELPDAVLEHLGWGLHIDGWDYAVSRELKLWLIRNFRAWHAHKGTAHGLALYWRVLLGRELLAASPPHKFYWGVSLTEAQRAAWEAPHPEIRVYPFRHAGRKAGWCWGASCFGADRWLQSEAIVRIGAAVELFDPLTGQSTSLHGLLYETTTAQKLARAEVEVRLPAKAVGVFASHGPWAGFWANHGAAGRLYSLRLDQPYLEETTTRRPMVTTPGLEPVRVGYRPGYVAGRAVGSFPANRHADGFQRRGGRFYPGGRQFWVDQQAELRVFKQIKLFDPARVRPTQRQARLFWGAFRLGGLPAHHAEVAVDLAGRAGAGAAFWGPAFWWGHAAWSVSDVAARIAQTRQVGKLAKRLSDKIALGVTNRKQVRAGGGATAGSLKAGQYRLEVF